MPGFLVKLLATALDLAAGFMRSLITSLESEWLFAFFLYDGNVLCHGSTSGTTCHPMNQTQVALITVALERDPMGGQHMGSRSLQFLLCDTAPRTLHMQTTLERPTLHAFVHPRSW